MEKKSLVNSPKSTKKANVISTTANSSDPPTNCS